MQGKSNRLIFRAGHSTKGGKNRQFYSLNKDIAAEAEFKPLKWY